MRNILIGYDGSRGAEAALAQGVSIADGLQARVRLVQAVEPVGVLEHGDVEVSNEVSNEPLDVLDRADKAYLGDEEPALPEDEDGRAAVLACEEAGVVCYWSRLHGMATRVLSEQSLAMDMLVLGRHGTTGRSAVGRTAAGIVFRPLIPTFLCKDEVMPLSRLLLAYETSVCGGRALKTAGELASGLNLGLDIVVADSNRRRGETTLAYVRDALRAYHVEGEYVHHRGTPSEAIQSAALELQSSVLVVSDGCRGMWPWSKSPRVRAAVEFPGAPCLIVP